ncbi:MAG TPA: fimbrial assembly protein FimA [Chloroflexi bacterium]|nr:fimbrial assembly protein FimA [Chloroflexota bacterium]
MQPITTFSIVAYDPGREEWGVAVQSKFLAVAAVVSWARVGAGAVATQSYANLSYGQDGLEMMAAGTPAEDTIEALIAGDEERDLRQLGLIDKVGRASAYTGKGCHHWAGHIVGQGYACQGNILIPGTVEAMAARYEEVRGGRGELADWLVAALAAGQEAGGDSRGRQAAGVLVVRENGGYGGKTDRYLDLRVDDDPYPIRKLQQLVEMHHLFFGQVNPEDLIPLAEVAADLQDILRRTGEYDGPVDGKFDEKTHQALRSLVGKENLEERWDGKGDAIDRKVVDYLKERFADKS